MVSQTSGSITIDTSGVAGAIVTALEPIMGQINGSLEHLAGLLAASALDEEAAVNALAENMPVAEPPGWPMSPRDMAGHLAEHLAQQGYALVAVNGPALERELARTGFRGVAVAPVVDPAEATRRREDEWFADGRDDS